MSFSLHYYDLTLLASNTSNVSSFGPPSLSRASQICPDPDWTVTVLSLTYDDVFLAIRYNDQDLLTFNFG
jgi:hypothetical protein